MRRHSTVCLRRQLEQLELYARGLAWRHVLRIVAAAAQLEQKLISIHLELEN